MANAAIFVKWGQPFPGREQKSLEVFMGGIEYWTRLKAEKKIEDFRIYLATSGNTENYGGHVTLEGELDQLRALMDTDEHQSLLLKARHLVTNVEDVVCSTGGDIPARVQQVQKVRKDLGI
jgi:hypothetical protein